MENELNYERLGSRIRRLRKAKDFTQELFAERCGISTAYIGHIERGTRKLSVETLSCIAKELNTSTDYLLGFDDEEILSVKGLSQKEIDTVQNVVDCLRDRK